MLTPRQEDLAELGLPINTKEIDKQAVRKQYKKLSLTRHPDKEGGSKESFQALKDACDRLLDNTYSRPAPRRRTNDAQAARDPRRTNDAARQKWKRPTSNKTKESFGEAFNRWHKEEQNKKREQDHTDYWRTDCDYDFDHNAGKQPEPSSKPSSTPMDADLYFDNWSEDLHNYAKTKRHV